MDVDGNGTIGVEDRTILGTSDPRFKMSLSNTLSWKNFELYFMLTGTFGGNGYYVSENAPAFLAGGGGGGAILTICIYPIGQKNVRAINILRQTLVVTDVSKVCKAVPLFVCRTSHCPIPLILLK